MPWRWFRRFSQKRLARKNGQARSNRSIPTCELLETRLAPAGAGPQLIKDLDTGTNSALPEFLPFGDVGTYAAVGSIAYYLMNDGVHGRQLWRSDGTAAGTFLLKQINSNGDSFTFGHSPNLTNVNGTLFFTPDDYEGGAELWKTDGTSAGTVPVADLMPGGTFPYLVGNLTAVGSTLFFTANDGLHGTELWKSDGTTNGTVLVKDILPGDASSAFTALTNVNGTLFFSANGALWRSNGTDAGTFQVMDFKGNNPSLLTNVAGTAYFVVNDPNVGTELWMSNGKAAGTVLVKDIMSGTGSSNPQDLVAIGSTLYFTAATNETGRELWKSNGTDAGTVLVKDIYPFPDTFVGPSNLVNVNGTLFFSADDGNTGPELWKSDGTTNGTVLVKDIAPSFAPGFPSNLTAVGSTLYFTASSNDSGTELWKSNGTDAGTVLVKDITPGRDSSTPIQLLNADGTLFFGAKDTVLGMELWKSNGTAAGTVLIEDVNQTNRGSVPFEFAGSNGITYFSAFTSSTGIELWRTDGTEAGTTLVKDIQPGRGDARPRGFSNFKGSLYFVAEDASFSSSLWRTDGTEAGTVEITAVSGSISTPFNTSLVQANGLLFFFVFDFNSGTRQLWRSDGTANGTFMLVDTVGFSYFDPIVAVGNTVYFARQDVTNGNELWKTDGTVNGTTLVKDIFPGPDSSTPTTLTNVNGTLYFQAADASGPQIWKSNGTAAGTIPLTTASFGFSVDFWVGIGSTLFFVKDDPQLGRELWKSDGTPNGTVLVKDIFPGSGGSSPNNLTNVNGVLYFTAYDGTTGSELWKSDGTAEGTVQVKDIAPGSDSSDPYNLTNLNGTLYFTAFTPELGLELWSTDGTANSTQIVLDINPGAASSYPYPLASVNGALYFTADDGVHGAEPWVLQAGTAPTARAGGPYILDPGQNLFLDGSGSTANGGATLSSFAWDLDNDGLFDDAFGATPTISSATLNALGIGSGTHTISLRVIDSRNATAIGTSTVTVRANSVTSLSINPQTATFGQLVTFTATVSPAQAGGSTPTGAITFVDGQTSLGTVPLVNGIATLQTSALSLGGHIVSAFYTGDSSFLSSTGTNTVTINAAAARALRFSVQPTTVGVGSSISPAVVVQLLDENGNVVTVDNTTVVTIGLGSNPGGGALGGTVSRTVVNGVATFNNLTISASGAGYTLTVSAAGFTGATSNSFSVISQQARVWDGGGANDRWTTAANWSGDIAPQAGDELVFPNGAARLNSTNDFAAGTEFVSITVDGAGYDIAGNSLILTSGLASTASTGTVVFRPGLTLNRDQTITVAQSGATLRLLGIVSGTGGLVKAGAGTLVLEGNNTWSGTTALNGGTLRLGIGEAASSASANWTLAAEGNAVLDLNNQSATLRALEGAGEVRLGQSGGTLTVGTGGASRTYAGVISGDGSVIKRGNGTFTLTGANTFSRSLQVQEGEVRLSGSGSLHDNLTITVSTGATFNLTRAGEETIQALTGDGQVSLAAGSMLALLVPEGASAVFNGQIQGAGGLKKAGPGSLTLTRDSGFSGQVDVSGGRLIAQSSRALGANNTALPCKVLVRAGATLVLETATPLSTDYSLCIDGGTLQNLNGANSWTGPIEFKGGTLRIDGGSLTLTGNLTGTGGFIKTGANDLALQTSSSTYQGETVVEQGKLIVGVSNALGSAAAGTRVKQNAILEFRSSTTINYADPEKLTLEKCTVIVNQTGDNSFAGALELIGDSTIDVQSGRLTLKGAVGVGTFTLTVTGNGEAVIQGVVSGTGTIELKGQRLDLQGQNTFTGTTRALNGRLIVTGKLPGTVVIENGAILGGNGEIGQGTIRAGGTFSPGNSPGLLTITNGIRFEANAVASFEFIGDIDAYVPGRDFDQGIIRDGMIDLSGQPELRITASGKVRLPLANTLTIFDNRSGQAVNGIFRNLPEGTIINIDQLGTLFQISYRGGDGNDIVLTRGLRTELVLNASAGTVPAGQGFSLTAEVRVLAPSLPRAVSGKVTLRDGATGRGEANVSGSLAGFNFGAGSLGAGDHPFQAVYDGDSDYIGSTSGLVNVVVQAPPPQNQFGQFTLSGSSFVVNERDGGLNIVVSRVNGSDGTVTVSYFVAVPDSLSSKQKATPGVDYQVAATGTLTFGPGETSKTITIGIVQDSLVEEDSESFSIGLANPTGGATLGNPAGASIAIRDDDLPPADDEAPKLQRLQLAAEGFGKSEEHYRDFVQKAYARFLNRAPDEQGFQYWVSLMKLYEDSKHTQGLRQENIEAGFLLSAEYVGRYGGIGEAWVRGIYKDLLGREADQGGLSFWLASLAAGGSPTQVALGFTTSLERLRNRVADTYRTLLDREADQMGLEYWVTIFQNGGTTEDIVSGFVGSMEYYTKPNRGAGNPAKWVRSAYQDVLFRPAGVGEFDYWMRFLNG